uniref:TIR domain-containing protein n=1 Tax=Candidatus Kentrum sp. FW TaxID=2126338 RepID=A0A450TQM1_9GAMM|nr:MAG: TIR domain-containing protein [Candidatus Kentron sp. FW]
MSPSVLVFISYASEDKEEYIEPIVRDLEDCFINVWLDKRRLVPGENLKKSILRERLDNGVCQASCPAISNTNYQNAILSFCLRGW